ncbi:hypothetical protein D1159_06530 [Pseudoflavonifractor sp. 524-17]|uniref:hypothetical protein n=1 Tax=Pseudoflavonifractor sp. 524-17 TaxID=2304577 RepID=UPI00137AAC6B|nr:hypothetical protein [Pseudoflavonifractor sp. 524-17]NCE64248.1 hypothetical protein [Pseudoflavonifractor sp. 524-17]
MTYQEFINTSNTLAPLAGNQTAQYIYQNIIHRSDVVGWMAIASELKLPALAVCAGEIEQYCAGHPGTLDLSDNLVRKSIGRMVRAALEPLGYEPVGKKSMPKEMGFQYFCGVAKRYEKHRPAKYVVQVAITPAEAPQGEK